MTEIRVGFGFDSHPIEEGKKLFLGGVQIESPFGLKGHSDGDVILHALTDAILGALGEKDIGQLFPDTDEKLKGASSEIFLKEALRRAKEKGYEVVNLDCTLIADAPKIAPHKERIRENLSRLLGIPKERISIKGKRTEGFCKTEGIVCMCVVLLGR
ncbi:MAG: 2-C-methyl-D-erythritol 2,4-cyclodiphosphate synthase [Aquificae bacterium]|nr:2-C-methyl-D-erythritol 2,4-cyclodiphosphate synthase [Aquificota bacterium]